MLKRKGTELREILLKGTYAGKYLSKSMPAFFLEEAEAQWQTAIQEIIKTYHCKK